MNIGGAGSYVYEAPVNSPPAPAAVDSAPDPEKKVTAAPTRALVKGEAFFWAYATLRSSSTVWCVVCVNPRSPRQADYSAFCVRACVCTRWMRVLTGEGGKTAEVEIAVNFLPTRSAECSWEIGRAHV